jgi:protein-disulfide isomerase
LGGREPFRKIGAGSAIRLRPHFCSDIEAIKEGQQALHTDLQELKALRHTRPAAAAAPAGPPRVVLRVAGAPFKGEKTATLTLIEFTDFQWPCCSRHVRETLPQLEQDDIKTGKVKYVTLDFPLESIHKNAFKAAEAARCAGAQGKYWEMHARLCANQGALDLKDLPAHAEALGWDKAAFQTCLESGRYAAAIRKDLTGGQQAGVTGTPAFFLGVTEPNDTKIKSLRQLTGAQPSTAFQAAIDSLLAEHK